MGAIRYDFKTPNCIDDLRMNCWPKTDAAATDIIALNGPRAYVAGNATCD